jgi:hypothetical protein
LVQQDLLGLKVQLVLQVQWVQQVLSLDQLDRQELRAQSLDLQVQRVRKEFKVSLDLQVQLVQRAQSLVQLVRRVLLVRLVRRVLLVRLVQLVRPQLSQVQLVLPVLPVLPVQLDRQVQLL